ncbi:multidrug effflux MFS transporter [Sphingomonas nostoxanthinifaciens]|uniref:multidrug effflux MFS transporter n=1 Tax=Sphingomonas nostoxanthinifaciens TaxID=2872652 RepID=UPI001CC2052D|nr:multidrug effflux MFS transporter [Sphingomonas nostoxanthinifaciens]UAK24792.1 multidrug effflux MFS transporter [Sphingomonas nostoxanthinifaciens]
MNDPAARAAPAPGSSDSGFGFRSFVALIASIMACNALQIDSMLAALPTMGRDLGVANENTRQWIIAVYMLGFGAAQIVFGPLADRFGRRPILIAGLTLNALMSLAAALAPTFTLMLVARALQGITGAAGRVLVVSIVRDCYQGRQMARVMSLSFVVFLAVPILAPSVGQAILLVGSWRFIFFLLAAFAGTVATVSALKLKETLHPSFRRPASLAGVARAMRVTVTERYALGYMLAGTGIYGALMGYINTVQQIFSDIFHAPQRFPLMFALAAAGMGVSALVNSRIVGRFGTRRVSHGALLGLIAAAAIHVAIAASGRETMLTFSILQTCTMFFFGMIGSNFGSMAMETMGPVAGTAASVQGFVQTCFGALIGIAIGQSFNGTTVPTVLGFLIVGLVALAIVLVTEHGRLFRPHHAPA